jgi:tRNA(Ile)-lysidine synthetase-like protein
MIKAIKGLISKEKTLYVATSMGVDSLGALHWLKWKGYKVIALHFNHKIRMQNDEMEKSFQKFCCDFNIEGICGYGKNLKTEADCRQARIDFYSTIFVERQTIVTAHHLNDWVESYLLNCFRGKPGHEPIPLKSRFSNHEIIHPFLLTRKKDFKQYVDRNDLRHYIVEDETNLVLKGSRRNWVRQTIVPEMLKNQISLEKFAERKIEILAQELIKQQSP